MSQSALWAIMRAYNIPDVDLLESIYSKTTVRMHPNDDECASISFDTGVAQGSALSPRLFILFMNALLEHLTHTGKAHGISHGIESTDQFNNMQQFWRRIRQAAKSSLTQYRNSRTGAA